MATIKVDSLTVSVKGYYLNNNSPYYQVFVPKKLRPLFGQHKASVALHGRNKRQHIDQCQHLNQRFRALFRAIRENRTPPPQSLHSVAQAWISEITVEIDAPKVEVPLLLSDAFELYVSNHGRGSDERFRSRQFAHWQRLTKQVGNISLKLLTREHARGYRDARLALGIKQSSVQREISSIKAVINVAIKEAPLAISNPFEGLVVNAPTMEHKASERLPYTRGEVQRLVGEALKVDDERRRIVLVLALTGARLAEVLGLRRQDVSLNEGAIHITQHDSRSLKTATSRRSVPLHSIGLEALRRQLNAHQGDYVFPTYCNQGETKANSASAAINKWAKCIVPNKTMHSFRHTMRDQLREVGCPDSVAKEIGGWSNGSDVSAAYGQGSSITLKRRWLLEAYSWVTLNNACGV